MYYVYVLKSEVDGRLYKGMTNNLQKRIVEHNSGKNKSTKGYLPWVLVYKEEFKTSVEARAREKYFKSGIGREFLKSILKN
ncbi:MULTISPECIES: GIY-YIG nuclease family protein [unclassified Maribacter]|uniref:GIY-YIG nuclease family protein n=1 Tax=unclassified Maribacter TaxID=2615042 RepID=UPI00257996F4|nr:MULTISPECIES: GIY-YIG nuclease family protein [unclassified Maribacter]|tara:strand:+ start:90 stop:332 length:243 start_codon:yes stop_codon:yes gene_type:complete